MALFRVDFCGRGELADRQQKLAQMLSRLQKISEGKTALAACNKGLLGPSTFAAIFDVNAGVDLLPIFTTGSVTEDIER